MARDFRKKVIVVLIMALCLAGIPGMQSLQAATGTTGTVTFTYEGIAGCTIQMYYVADYSETDGYTLSSAFVDTAMSRQDLLDGKWYSLAMTLETLVVGNQISADASGETDANGQLILSNLQEGLYLVTIERMTVGDTVYTAQPLLIMVPDYLSDGTKDYDQNITITKYETSDVQATTSVSVQKVWDDEDSSSRPSSITVFLLEGTDGTVADTQVLSESNSWRCTWSGLDGSKTWFVLEEDMTEYGVSYSQADDGTIVITNQQGTGRTHGMGNDPVESTEDDTTEIVNADTESTETSEETETDSAVVDEDTENTGDNSNSSISDSEDMIYQNQDDTESSESGDDSDNTEGSEGTETASDSKLPQTGADWGVALILAGAAAACFVMGIKKNVARGEQNR